MVSGVCRDGVEEGTKLPLFIEYLSGWVLQDEIACTLSHNKRLIGSYRRVYMEEWRGVEGWICHTVKRFKLLQPCFDQITWNPFVCVTHEALMIESECSWEASSLVKSAFVAILVRFVVSVILYICSWRVLWLHSCVRNARIVSK